MSVLRFPYTDLHTLNLDWIIEQLNKEGAVLSVNDKHGIVVLTGEDIKRNTTTPETVSQALSSQGTAIQTVRTQIGTTPLPTTAQSLTGAIAENAGEIADLQDNVIGSTQLPTTAQTLTGAIAENAQSIADVEDDIGSTPMGTTAQTLTGAIAEDTTRINTLSNTIGNTPMGTTATTITGAVAEHESEISAIQTNNCKIAVFNWEPTGAEASVTSGTAVTIDSLSNIVPSGGTARGVVKFSSYGASNYDYDGSLMIVGGNLRYMPRLTQTSIKVYGAILYT